MLVNRRPFPDYTPKTDKAGTITGAQYEITDSGRVCREDGKYMTPYSRTAKPKTVYVRLGGGLTTRSLPAAVAAAFATTSPPDDGRRWIAISKPGAPKTKPDGLPSCAFKHLVWVPYSEACAWTRNDVKPKTQLSIT